jgi:hypothetical protein
VDFGEQYEAVLIDRLEMITQPNIFFSSPSMSTLRLTPTPQTHKTHQGHHRTAGPRLDFMSAYILRLDFMSASPNARLYVGDLSYYIYPPHGQFSRSQMVS